MEEKFQVIMSPSRMACGLSPGGSWKVCVVLSSAVCEDHVSADSMRSAAGSVRLNDDAPAGVPRTAMVCPAADTVTG